MNLIEVDQVGFVSETCISCTDWNSVFPGSVTDSDDPVIGITWFDAVLWCNLKSTELGLEPPFEIDNEPVTEIPQIFVYKNKKILNRFRIKNSATGFRLLDLKEWEDGQTSGLLTYSQATGGYLTTAHPMLEWTSEQNTKNQQYEAQVINSDMTVWCNCLFELPDVGFRVMRRS